MSQASIDQSMREGARLHSAGRLAEAETFYRRVLSEQPNHAEALHHLGLIAAQRGHFQPALELVRRAAQIQPDNADAHNNLGNLQKETGRIDEAIDSYRRAIQLKPKIAEAHCNLGVALKDRGQLQEAIAELRCAVQLAPKYAHAHSNLGNALRDAGLLDEALQSLRNAVALKDDFPVGHNNLGTVLRDKGLPAEAVAEFQRAVALRPDYANAHANLGLALNDLCRIDESIASYQRAIALQPEFGDPHWNLAQSLLLKGDFARGWREYEWRFKILSLKSPPRFPNVPQWDGEPMPGKRILVHAEQGFGDAIQFVRFAPQVAERRGKVIFECAPELMRLFAGFPGISELIAKGDALPDFDVQCPLLSLPLALGTDLNSIPARTPYLHPNAKLEESWRLKLNILSAQPRIGVAWAGAAGHKNDRKRSIPFETFAKIFQSRQANWISLQKGDGAGPGDGLLHDWITDLNDFAETAALISNLDLVITVDSAVAHLAGALGKKTWVLLPFVPDWRWMLEREDSPWYPSLRLFRQQSIGDWAQVLDRVARELQTL